MSSSVCLYRNWHFTSINCVVVYANLKAPVFFVARYRQQSYARQELFVDAEFPPRKSPCIYLG